MYYKTFDDLSIVGNLFAVLLKTFKNEHVYLSDYMHGNSASNSAIIHQLSYSGHYITLTNVYKCSVVVRMVIIIFYFTV